MTRKSELAELQKASKPFGGLAATRYGEARRVFQSPGPLYEPEGARPDYWRLARAHVRRRAFDAAISCTTAFRIT